MGELPTAFFVTAAVGLAIGLRFRIPLLLTSAILLSVAMAVAAAQLGWTISRFIVVTFGLLAVQQVSYLIGLIVSSYLPGPRNAKTELPTKET